MSKEKKGNSKKNGWKWKGRKERQWEKMKRRAWKKEEEGRVENGERIERWGGGNEKKEKMKKSG